jgi:hypothetical protein
VFTANIMLHGIRQPYEGQIDIYLLIIFYLERVWFKQRYIYIYIVFIGQLFIWISVIFSLFKNKREGELKGQSRMYNP